MTRVDEGGGDEGGRMRAGKEEGRRGGWMRAADEEGVTARVTAGVVVAI